MTGSLAAVAALALWAWWRSRRDPRVWTVWAGVHPDGGHCTPIGSRKRRREAEAMVGLDPAGRVAVDARVWPGVLPPRDGVLRDTVIWGGAEAEG